MSRTRRRLDVGGCVAGRGRVPVESRRRLRPGFGGRVRCVRGGDRCCARDLAARQKPVAEVVLTQSPYDRTAAFLGGRYRRNPVAFCAFVLAAAWALWTLYEVLSTPSSGFGWYLRARTVIEQTGSGLIIAVGAVWLVDIMRGG